MTMKKKPVAPKIKMTKVAKPAKGSFGTRPPKASGVGVVPIESPVHPPIVSSRSRKK